MGHSGVRGLVRPRPALARLWAERLFVALPTSGDLFICAKDLRVEAICLRLSSWKRSQVFRRECEQNASDEA